MLSGIFQKRKKIQELRAPTLQDIKRFRDVYARHAEKRHVETPSCFEKTIYKAISCQKELHSVDFRQEDVTDPQIIALAESLLEMPLVSSLDLHQRESQELFSRAKSHEDPKKVLECSKAFDKLGLVKNLQEEDTKVETYHETKDSMDVTEEEILKDDDEHDETIAEGEDEDDEEAEMFGDWEKGFDPNTNHYFWFNHATGESQWTPPEGWPYEVDTPFDDDADLDDEQGEASGNADDQEGSAVIDDDLFSDHDLPDESMIEVILNDRLGKKIRVKCNEDDTVGDLKKLVAAQVGTRPEKIRIQKWYTIYKDHITLEDYEIHDGMGLELYYT
ncbi:hypothetical protein P43SY_004896 [Pythium insidiosum]|uniref:Ubiquitin-like domain-containing protein n=1 Tax=Pythium insidiosum TaxID=114742 RepID=A0AAD5QCQ4_PYTIN|nr:hypothetical protein P43SY_004896 [Pythium insidiosum]